MKRKTVAAVAVENKEVYGRWSVEGLATDSTRKVLARCLDCDTVYEVDIYHLRRTDRTSTRCKRCNNIQISVGNRLAAGEHLTRQQYREYQKAATARGYEWKIDESEFKALVFKDCFYCGAPPSRLVESSWDSIRVNGIDRVENGMGYEIENCVTCCKICNYAKRDLSQSDFIDMCKKVAERW